MVSIHSHVIGYSFWYWFWNLFVLQKCQKYLAIKSENLNLFIQLNAWVIIDFDGGCVNNRTSLFLWNLCCFKEKVFIWTRFLVTRWQQSSTQLLIFLRNRISFNIECILWQLKNFSKLFLSIFIIAIAVFTKIKFISNLFWITRITYWKVRLGKGTNLTIKKTVYHFKSYSLWYLPLNYCWRVTTSICKTYNWRW